MTAQTEFTPDTFKVLLKKLVQTPSDFSPEDCGLAFEHMVVQGASEAQAGAFLTALTLSGLDSAPETVAACADVLRRHAIAVKDLVPKNDVDDPHGHGMWDYRDSDKEGDRYRGLVDIVGTGGDGWDTYNVSTTAAVVVAGAGVRVAKVCGASVAGQSAADLIARLPCGYLDFGLCRPVDIARLQAVVPRRPDPRLPPCVALPLPLRATLPPLAGSHCPNPSPAQL